jgi:predicted DNA-binding helix-hairpin-helix protein
MALLAPAKSHATIEATMGLIKAKIGENSHQPIPEHKRAFAPGGQSTQLIVGATASTDADILKTALRLYSEFDLRRVYYTGYRPIPHADARLPEVGPSSLRENRLYQAEWLLRFGGFTLDELVSTDTPNLDLYKDPKLRWAMQHREFFPVDINRADREQLLRIPGVGPKTAERIIEMRRHHPIRLADLMKLKIGLGEARCFVKTADRNPALSHLDKARIPLLTPPAYQLIGNVSSSHVAKTH